MLWSRDWKREIVFTERNSIQIFCKEKAFSFNSFAAHSWALSLSIKSNIFWSVIYESNHYRYFIIIAVFIQIFALCLHFISREEMLILFLSKQWDVITVSINQESSLWDSLTLQQFTIVIWVFSFLQSVWDSVTRVVSDIIFQ